MSALPHEGEKVKLARVLGVAPERLAFLDAVALDTLRPLRERLAATFVDDARPLLTRAVKASRLLTVGMVASIGERVFGPLLCGHMAGIMEPGRAVDVSMRMSPGFLADVSSLLEPRRAAAVIAAMPADRIVAVAKILGDRGDHVTLARFVSYLSDATILKVIAAIPGDEPLLRTAAFLESKATLDKLVMLVPLERLQSVARFVAAAGTAADTWGIADLRAELDAALARRT